MADFNIMWQGSPDMANWLSVDLCPPLCGVAARKIYKKSKSSVSTVGDAPKLMCG